MLTTATSPASRPAVAARSPASRSAVANRTRLHRDGDGRSASARRFRDLVADLAAPFGGLATIGELDLALCRAVAAKMIEAEEQQAKLAGGESLDANASVRVANSLDRLLGRLDRRRKALAPKPTSPLVEHFSRPPAPRAD